jgi:hypothetical protein
MSLAQKVRLELDDGRKIEATYDGRDLRAWESKTHKSALAEQMSLGMLTWLGHHAGVRAGVIDGELKDYAKFDEACVSVEGVRDDVNEEPPDPTKASPKTAGDDSSAPSP